MRSARTLRHGMLALLFSSFILAGALVTLSACNTTAGVGQDVSATGHAVTNSAEKLKQKM
jgi:entericidin B